jgi:hypothetical protein
MFLGEAVMRGLGADIEGVADLLPGAAIVVAGESDLLSGEHFEGLLGADGEHGEVERFGERRDKPAWERR